MAFNFPSSPVLDQTFTSGSSTYKYNGSAWIVVGVAAAPYDAMAYSGMQINGGMEVSQEFGATGRSSVGYVCDGWLLYFGGTMSLSAAGQFSPSIIPGFPNFLGCWTNTAQASLGASDVAQFYQFIEGYRIARLAWGTANAQSITIGFWSAHHRPGLYSGVVGNNPQTHTYAFAYTHAAADVAQYNTVTIPGCPSGTWKTDNAIAMALVFSAACGSGLTAPSANTWLVGNYNAAPGQINAVAATSDVFRLTGVTVLPGTQAPTAAQSPNIMRPYDQELVTCQRYFNQLSNIVFDGYGGPGAPFYNTAILPLTMRASPTVGGPVPSYSNASGGGLQSANPSAITLQAFITAAGNGVCIFSLLSIDARL